MDRRFLLLGAALLPLGELLAQGAHARDSTPRAWPPPCKALGLAQPQASRDLLLDAPDIAENGALVRVELASKLPGVKRLWLVSEKNPVALLAAFELSDALEPRLATQIKLAESGMVYGIAQMSDGKLLMAQKDVKVTLGGCAA